MASQGPNSPSSGVSQNSGPGPSWTNPGNITASDNSDATPGSTGSGTTSDRLYASGFGFSIPAGATIDGFLVEIEGSRTGNVSIGQPRLTKDGSTYTSGIGSIQAMTGTDAYYSFGGSTELAGTTWTDSEVNASGFGVGFQVAGTSPSGGTANMDHLRVTVYYSTGNPWHAYAQQ